MTKKKFFEDESIDSRISRTLEYGRHSDDLDILLDNYDGESAILFESNLTNSLFRPAEFSEGKDPVYSGRRHLRRGQYWDYNHPRTIQRARKSRSNPWQLRERALKNLNKIPSPTKLGFRSQGLRSRDQRFRLMPLVYAFEGARIYTYSEGLVDNKQSTGIDIDSSYINAFQAEDKGAIIRASVPSRTKGGSKYSFTLRNVPVKDNQEKRVIIWNLDHENVVDFEGEPQKGTTDHEQYLMDYDPEKAASVVWFYPHHIAAYHKFSAEQQRKGNMVPLEMNPFPIPSKKAVRDYMILRNRVLIDDPTKKGKHKVRALHIDEISVILMRRAANFGADEYLFNHAKRDGKLRDYSWTIE